MLRPETQNQQSSLLQNNLKGTAEERTEVTSKRYQKHIPKDKDRINTSALPPKSTTSKASQSLLVTTLKLVQQVSSLIKPWYFSILRLLTPPSVPLEDFWTHSTNKSLSIDYWLHVRAIVSEFHTEFAELFTLSGPKALVITPPIPPGAPLRAPSSERAIN